MIRIAKNLKLLRKKTKTLQKELAAHLGLRLRTYQSYEYGEYEPDLATIEALADFYRITIDELVRGHIDIE